MMKVSGGQIRSTGSHTSDGIVASCSCSTSIFQLMQEEQDLSTVEFQRVLDVGSRFVAQCEAVLSCRFCHDNHHSLSALWILLERMLVLYEAACVAYSFDFHGPAPHTHHTTTIINNNNNNNSNYPAISTESPSPSSAVVCRRTKVAWGTFELRGEDSRLLVQIILRRRLIVLEAILDELRQRSAALWGKAGVDSHESPEASALVDKLVGLMGLLR